MRHVKKIVIDDSKPNDDQADWHKKPDHDKDSMASIITINSNLTLVGLHKISRKHHHKPPLQITKTLCRIEQIDDIGLDDIASQISKTSTLLSDILKTFDKEFHNKRVQF